MKVIKSPNFSISFCTTCMGRLHHLKETLPYNIASCEATGIEYEICLVNWSSPDGMDEWVQSNYADMIRSGRMKYLHVKDKQYFERALAKNTAHRLATKAFVCNVDADNFLSEDYIKEVKRNFKDNPNIFIRGSGKGAIGRMCLSRNNFINLGGYDEDFKNYGQEDVNLRERAADIGLLVKRVAMVQAAIEHDDASRIENSELKLDVLTQHNLAKEMNDKKRRGIHPPP